MTVNKSSDTRGVLTVRAPGEEDLGDIAEVLVSAFPAEAQAAFGDEPDRQLAGVRALLRANAVPWRTGLVAELDGEVVGLAALAWPDEKQRRGVWRELREEMPPFAALRALIVLSLLGEESAIPGEGLLSVLGVRKEARKQGIGCALVQASLEAARRRDLDAVRLSVASNNPVAMRLYERTGFRRKGRWFAPWCGLMFGFWRGYEMVNEIEKRAGEVSGKHSQ